MHRPTGLPIPSSKLPERLLVIGASARLLAESAARAHIRVVALDHYADADTRSLAEQVHAIPTRHGCFRPEPLLEHAARLAPALHYPLVYGSGLDSRPELLERLAADRVVFGNPPSVLALFREPRHFFELLDRCAIPYPDIRYRRPENPENWLIKSGCSEGGKRVRFCAHNRPGPGDYYQRRISGRAFSVLFLADGENVRFMGFNTLWTSKTPGRFLFEGAMNWAPLSLEQRRRIEGNAVKLVKATGLKGLNSLDFMVDVRGGPLTIEVNTRPSATMALYDEDYSNAFSRRTSGPVRAYWPNRSVTKLSGLFVWPMRRSLRAWEQISSGRNGAPIAPSPVPMSRRECPSVPFGPKGGVPTR